MSASSPTDLPSDRPTQGSASARELELTILMPCLNEAESLPTCLANATDYLTRSGIAGEVIVADNGSTDGSVVLARQAGARMVSVPTRGYGAALSHGIAAAKGRYVVMGDSDDSYDFSDLDGFVEALRAGHDLVMGNRFKGGIEPGGMPFLHRYLGNPVLSFIGRLFFRAPVGDFHCGLRGFRRDSIRDLNLSSTGMEFASEMIVRATLAGLSIAEVPTKLSKDGRSRSPHLNTWRDGWRHLKFLLLFSPRWLFLYTGLALMFFGGALMIALLPGGLTILPDVTLDLHSMIFGGLAVLTGVQGVSFSIVARRYAASRGLLPPDYPMKRFFDLLTLERLLIAAALLLVCGLAGTIYSVFVWGRSDFGLLQTGSLVRLVMISGTSVALGVQITFTAFLAEMIEGGDDQP